MRRLIALLAASLLGFAGALVVAAPAAAATLTVTSALDSGPGTLRDAVAAAGEGDTIEFAPAVSTIELASMIEIPRGVVIDGGGDVTISREPGTAFTQFYLYPDDADQDYVIRNITLIGVATSTGNAIVGGHGRRTSFLATSPSRT